MVGLTRTIEGSSLDTTCILMEKMGVEREETRREYETRQRESTHGNHPLMLANAPTGDNAYIL